MTVDELMEELQGLLDEGLQGSTLMDVGTEWVREPLKQVERVTRSCGVIVVLK